MVVARAVKLWGIVEEAETGIKVDNAPIRGALVAYGAAQDLSTTASRQTLSLGGKSRYCSQPNDAYF